MTDWTTIGKAAIAAASRSPWDSDVCFVDDTGSTA
jgi:hypothetical protein